MYKLELHKQEQATIHSVPLTKVMTEFNTTTDGLSSKESTYRLTQFGPNKLTDKKELPIIFRFLLQFNNFFSYLLLLGSGLSFTSEYLSPGEGSIYVAWALIGVTFLNATFTFIQEYKAEEAMKSFRNLMTSTVVVFRDGKKEQIESSKIVPGDIIYLSEGDKITADARLIEQNNLKVDHSALTGESEPQLRNIKSTSKNVLLSRNMIFSGTLVQSGSGKAVVIATGDHTQIGKIAKVTSEVKTKVSHLQSQIAHFIKIISYIAIFLGIAFFIMGIFITKNDFWTNMVFAIGIIVANVPEGLLPTVTLTLSIAAQKMAKRNVLIKNMDAIETLGSLTVICSDKTGTLTENNLFVHGFYMNGRLFSFDRQKKNITLNSSNVRMHTLRGASTFNDILILCNNSTYDKDKRFGDSTEICLKDFGSSFYNIKYIEREHPRTHEIPFTSETKYMITANKFDRIERAHMKGAPEIVLERCNRIHKDGKLYKLNSKNRKEILAHNKEYSKNGFRVLGCAMKETTKATEKDLERKDYIFYGLIIMQDPPRSEVPKAVSLCHEAGIKIIVISGDQASTVESIARQVGIIKNEKPIIVNGPDLPKYTDEELKRMLKSPEILFARTLPKDKLRIVSILKDMSEIVAVTGDGVNDAPAIRKADVGLAMGKSGTEVAKEAADVILLDDNFASIVNAIKEGRTVYDNIKRFIIYILTSNTPEIVPFLLFVLFGWPLALPVLLILAIDLGTDMLPAIGLGMEPSGDHIMKKKPRNPKSNLLNWKMIARSYGFIGPLQTTFSYIIFFWILMTGGWIWGTDIGIRDPLYLSAVTGFFATIVITQIFNVFACRTTIESVFSKKLFSNRFILIGIASELLLLVAITMIPWAEKIMGTALFPIGFIPWMIGAGFIILFCEEVRKWFVRKYGWFDTEIYEYSEQ